MDAVPILQKISVNGIELAYFEKGHGPLVICLHGFPDSAYGLAEMVDRLAIAGYRAVAPFLRGYYPSALAQQGDYSLPTVARDILALIDALYDGDGEPAAALIGHDWGGLTAYHAANLAPQKVTTITALAIPHMHSAKMSWQQFKNIWYTLFFQLPWLPEYLVARNDFAFIEMLYRLWSPSWKYSEKNIVAFKDMAKHPDVLMATLAYYRCMVRGATAESKTLLTQQTDVPALWFAGEEDGCVAVDQFEGIEKSFIQGGELVVVKGAGHFPHCEQPEQVYPKILAFMDKYAQGNQSGC